MKIKRITILWIVGLIGAFFIGMIYSDLNDFSKPDIASDNIYSPTLQKGIFIKKKAWGVSSNHHVVFITNDELSDEPDPKNDLVFNQDEDIFYKVKGDSLLIFTRTQKDISNFKCDFRIRIEELSNPQFMGLFDEYHQGLKTSNWMK